MQKCSLGGPVRFFFVCWHSAWVLGPRLAYTSYTCTLSQCPIEGARNLLGTALLEQQDSRSTGEAQEVFREVGAHGLVYGVSMSSSVFVPEQHGEHGLFDGSQCQHAQHWFQL